MHVTTDGGQTLEGDQPGPDAERQDASSSARAASRPTTSASSTAGVIFAIAESPREKGVIWAGTNDGLVQVTRDGGATWTNVTAQHPGPAAVGHGAATSSRRATTRGTAYVTVDLHQVNNRDPFVYKTTDYGKTWKLITTGIPKSVAQLRPLRPGGSRASRAALPRHRERALRVVRRRRELAAAAERTCRTRPCTG